jgi:hypothetical protein
MTDEQRINDYARRLGWSLQRLDPAERASLVGEIRSHLTDCAVGGEGALDRAIAGLGAPHALGRRFVEEYQLSGAMAAAGPLDLLRALLGRSSRRVLAVTTAFAGALCYLLTFTFATMAMVKPFAPAHVGAWQTGGAWMAGMLTEAPAAPELLGWWTVPLAIALAIGCYLLGTLILRGAGARLLGRAG